MGTGLVFSECIASDEQMWSVETGVVWSSYIVRNWYITVIYFSWVQTVPVFVSSLKKNGEVKCIRLFSWIFLLNVLVRSLKYTLGMALSKRHSVSRIRIWPTLRSCVLDLFADTRITGKSFGDPKLWHITAEQKNPLFFVFHQLQFIPSWSTSVWVIFALRDPDSDPAETRDIRNIVWLIHHGFVLCKHNTYYRQPVFRIRIRINRIHMFLDRIH